MTSNQDYKITLSDLAKYSIDTNHRAAFQQQMSFLFFKRNRAN